MAKKNKVSVKSFVYMIATILVAMWILVPLYFVFISSFKSNAEIFQYPPNLLFDPSIQAYVDALFPHGTIITEQQYQLQWSTYFANSAAVSLSATALAFLIGIPGAYALASLRIKRRNFIAFNILSIRMLPPIAVIPSIYLMMYFLGFVDTHLGMILIYTVFDLPWVIWIMRAFMQQIPSEIAEAAELDGAGRLTYLTRILLPLVKPGLAVTAVFCILQGWNDFPVAFILGGRHTITVPVALSTLMSGRQLHWNGIFAVGVINMIPALVLTFSVRKYWAKGLTLGLVE